jgi:hypothetical protein
MKFLFNPISGVFDIVESTGGGGSGTVNGVPPTTIGAIVQWANIDGTLIANSPGTFVQASGAIEMQAALQDRQILNLVTVPQYYTMLQTDVYLVSGDIVLDSDSTLLLL